MPGLRGRSPNLRWQRSGSRFDQRAPTEQWVCVEKYISETMGVCGTMSACGQISQKQNILCIVCRSLVKNIYFYPLEAKKKPV